MYSVISANIFYVNTQWPLLCHKKLELVLGYFHYSRFISTDLKKNEQ
uniref:Uncharacterized protein n=1 Tax=Anguilla anguilla TaxID=7936 RepID=A0A0E9QV73_ANGAN